MLCPSAQTITFLYIRTPCLSVKYRVEQEQSDPEWSGVTPEWKGVDNKSEKQPWP